MIPIAKGKFSQPRQNRRVQADAALTEAPAARPGQKRAADPALAETMVLTGSFDPIRDADSTSGMPPLQSAPRDTITFDEAQFLEQTASDEQESYSDEQEEYYEEPVRPAKKSRSRRSSSRKILLIAICTVTLLLLAAIITGVMLYFNANQDDGLILNNVTIAGVNIGGMTPEEAAAAIHRITDLTFTVENMVIYLPDTILELTPDKTRAKLDVDAAVQAAYNYGRTGTAEENKQAQADSLVSNHTIALLPYLNLDLDYIRSELEAYGEYFNSDYAPSAWTLEGEKPQLAGDQFDENAAPQTLVLTPGKPGRYVDIDQVYNDVLDAFSMNTFEVRTEMTDEEQTPDALDLDAIWKEICSESVDASMDMETFEVTMEVYGYTFDLEKAKELLSQTEYGSSIGIPMEYVVPKVLSDDLAEKLFRDELGYCETPHTNDSNRNTNLKLACEAINGHILMPGDSFDYNKILGERTEEKGYKPAGALSAGTSTTEVGGGICQVSSTLYYCTLLADLQIDERRSHSLPSSYMPMTGVDATVSWGGPNFCFTNNTDYPIRIEAEVSGGYVKVRLVGTDTKDYYVKMEAKIVDSQSPKTIYEEYTKDEAKARGYRDGQVKQQPITGYTVYSYKVKYDKETDEFISRDLEAVSNYVCKDKIVIRIIDDEPEEPKPEETKPAETEPAKPEETTPPETQAPTAPPETEAPATEPAQESGSGEAPADSGSEGGSEDSGSEDTE